MDEEKNLPDSVENGYKTGGITPALAPLPDIPEIQQENPYITYFRDRDAKLSSAQHNIESTEPFTFSPIFDELQSSLHALPATGSNGCTGCPDVVQSPRKQKSTICEEWAANGIGIPFNDLPFELDSNSPQNTPPTSIKTAFDFSTQKYPHLFKSRYSSIDCYINDAPQHHYHPHYNDQQFPYHLPSYLLLKDHNVDSLLSKHIASLFMRDPLVMFNGQINQDDFAQVNHFESIQSTNWRSVRYKPPSHLCQPGFRTEFRTCELQFTDFENAAFTCLITLLARSIVYFNLNLYIPLTKVDENFEFAHQRDSIIGEKFWFRHTSHISLNDLQRCPSNIDVKVDCSKLVSKLRQDNEAKCQEDADYFTQLSLDEIFNGQKCQNGQQSGFVGLIPIVQHYLGLIHCDPESLGIISNYLSFISRRASGQLLSGAQFQRQFILNHPLYTQKKDSLLPEKALNDLLMIIHGIENLTIVVPELLGDFDKSILFDSAESNNNNNNNNNNDFKPATILSMATIIDTLNNHYDDKTTLLHQLIAENKALIGSSPSCTGCHNGTKALPDGVSVCPGCSNDGIHQPTNSAEVHPMYNSRSNFQRLLGSHHMSRLPRTFSVESGNQMLELPAQLDGSTVCRADHDTPPSMTELHTHILPTPPFTPTQEGVNSIPFESIDEF
jgi:hypothetical protein